MVEAWIDQVQRGDGNVPGIRDVTMCRLAGANSMRSPERCSRVVEAQIAFPFEGGLARRLPEQEALTGEPAARIRAFGAALGRMEAGDRCNAVMDERGVSDIDHIGTAGLGMEQTDVGNAAQDVVKALPLGEGEIAGGSVNVARHPWVQDVIDVVPLRRAHNVCWAGKQRG